MRHLKKDKIKKMKTDFRQGQLTISTTIDGEEKIFSVAANLALSPFKASIKYTEDGDDIQIDIASRGVSIKRIGELTEELCFRKGQTEYGKIGLSGSEGDVGVKTEKLAYRISEDSVLLQMTYRLLFGHGEQVTKIRLLARIKN